MVTFTTAPRKDRVMVAIVTTVLRKDRMVVAIVTTLPQQHHG